MDAAVQLNVRMERSLRDAGNAALESKGISPSAYIRAVWSRLAERGQSLEDMVRIAYGEPVDTRGEEPQPERPAFKQQLLFDSLLQEVGLGAASGIPLVEERPYHEMLEDALAERWREKELVHG